MTFRFDDVCANSDMELHNQLTDFILERFHRQVDVIWAVSPLVFDTQIMFDHKTPKNNQRPFPEFWKPLSDHRTFYQVNRMGDPHIRLDVKRATHGLVHVDHRLLGKEAQEMSILVSANLTNSKIFVPPFNKYNQHTIDICEEQDIELVRFEDGWKSMEYNKWESTHQNWYLHAREWTLESFKKWFINAK